MCKKYANLNAQLWAKKLHVQDIIGDGKSLFKAASYVTFGCIEQHLTLLASEVFYISEYMLTSCSLFNLSAYDLNDLVSNFGTPGHVADKSVLCMHPDVLHKNVSTYLYIVSCSFE